MKADCLSPSTHKQWQQQSDVPTQVQYQIYPVALRVPEIRVHKLMFWFFAVVFPFFGLLKCYQSHDVIICSHAVAPVSTRNGIRTPFNCKFTTGV